MSLRLKRQITTRWTLIAITIPAVTGGGYAASCMESPLHMTGEDFSDSNRVTNISFLSLNSLLPLFASFEKCCMLQDYVTLLLQAPTMVPLGTTLFRY